MRGVWVTNTNSNFDSLKNIQKIVQLASASNINSIFMCVWNAGFTMYKSSTMKKKFGYEIEPKLAGRDPL